MDLQGTPIGSTSGGTKVGFISQFQFLSLQTIISAVIRICFT